MYLNKCKVQILLAIMITMKRSIIIWQLYIVNKYELFQNKTVSNWDYNINEGDFPIPVYIMRQQHHFNIVDSTNILVNEETG